MCLRPRWALACRAGTTICRSWLLPCCWSRWRRSAAGFPTRRWLLGLAAGLRPKHPGKNEADPAEGACRLALQRCLDLLIFLKHLGRDRSTALGQRDLEVGLGHFGLVQPAAERRQAGAADQVFKVGAGKALGALCDRFEIDVVGERHALGVDGEDAAAPGGIGDPDIDQLVEASGAKQRRVDQGGAVGGAGYDDGLPVFQAVPIRHDGSYQPLGDLRLAEAAAARRYQAVELVDEDDRRRDLSSAVEQASDLLLALAIPFAEQVRRFGGDEIRLR